MDCLSPARRLCSWDFPGKEYWSGLPCLPPGDLPDPGLKPAPLRSPALASGFFTTSTTWEVHLSKTGNGKNNNKEMVRDFLGGPVVKTSLSNAWVWVQSLVGKLRSPMPLGQKNRTFSNRSDTATNSIKTLKMVHIKKDKSF